MNLKAFSEAASALGLNLSAEQLQQFTVFEQDLYDQNQIMNLTRVDEEDCWRRHFLDSLLVSPLIGESLEVLDIGCGPGFPSWPLACARLDMKLTALDSNGKMLGFLRRHPLPNLEVIQDRAEDWGRREVYDVVTGRAVAPLPIQLELSAPTVKVGGLIIPLRTPNDVVDSPEWSELGLELVSIETVPLEGTDIMRVFPIYKKVKSTFGMYPRSWTEIKNHPIAPV